MKSFASNNFHNYLSRRYYSTSCRSLASKSLPTPIKVLDKLHNKETVASYRIILKNKGGIYSFINTINNKQYIGSAKDFYLRLNEHISNRKSNSALQSALKKHGLDKFNFCIYEYFSYDKKDASHKVLTDLETCYIKKFDFNYLYNFMSTATDITGYKHTDKAKIKMSKRFEEKRNHPFFGKSHSKESLLLISKPGKLNPMFGKVHSALSKKRISDKLSKHPYGVGIYDLNDNLISRFKNNSELAKSLNISRVTVARYLNSGVVYNKVYRFKVNKE